MTLKRFEESCKYIHITSDCYGGGGVSCEFLRQRSSRSEASFVYFMVDTCTFIQV